MKLAELKVNEFADVLSSNAPAPGGGSTAALEGALGAALTAMVCGLTVGRKKYADFQELTSNVQVEAEKLKARFMDVMDRDTGAFDAVSAAYGMPKETDDQKSARSEAIQSALKGCTKTPMEMMELAVETLELTHSILGKSNASALSDLGVSALSLGAAMRGAWLNVLINIGSVKDQAFADEYRARGEDLLTRGLPLSEQIYQDILQQM